MRMKRSHSRRRRKSGNTIANIVWILLLAVVSIVVIIYAVAECSAKGADWPAKKTRYLLVDKGKGHCVIIIPAGDRTYENFALGQMARKLAQVLEVSTGVKVPVLSESASEARDVSAGVFIHVGHTQLVAEKKIVPKGIKLDGFVIKAVDENTFALVGGRSMSTHFAVGEFLEKYLGVMWIWPGEYGIVIPKHERVEILLEDEINEPVFESRMIGGIMKSKLSVIQNLIGNRMHLHFNKACAVHEGVSFFHHNFFRIYPPEKYLSEHPEYYAEVNGKRLRPKKGQDKDWQVCTSNPEVIQVAIEAAKKYFAENPDKRAFSIAQNDGKGYCTCKQCKALDCQCKLCRDKTSPYYNSLTDRFVVFANAVADGIAASHPDKLIACLAYSANDMPPHRVKLRKNIIMFVVVPRISKIEGWSKWADHLGVWLWMHGKPVPKFYPHALASYLKRLKELGVEEFYAEYYPRSYELDGPRFYLTTKLFWNPYQDVDALIEKFCKAFYSAAYEPMLKYYQRLEQAWNRREGERLYDFSERGKDWKNPGWDIYTYEDIVYLDGCIEQALSMANTEESKQRILILQNELGKMKASGKWKN